MHPSAPIQIPGRGVPIQADRRETGATTGTAETTEYLVLRSPYKHCSLENRDKILFSTSESARSTVPLNVGPGSRDHAAHVGHEKASIARGARIRC